MIDAIIAGKLFGQPQQRTSANGRPFVTAKVRVPTRDGDALFASVITFSTTVQAALLALGDGDSVALSGELTPKVWTDKQGATHPALDVMAHSITTAYHVQRRRQAMAKGKDAGPSQGPPRAPAPAGDLPDDELDF